MYSIRDRLNYTIIAAMIVVLAAAAIFLFIRVSSQVEAVFDRALLDRAQAMISLTELDDEGLEFDFAGEDVMPEFDSEEDPQYYQLWVQSEDLWIQGGESSLRSPLLKDSDLPRLGLDTGPKPFRRPGPARRPSGPHDRDRLPAACRGRQVATRGSRG